MTVPVRPIKPEDFNAFVDLLHEMAETLSLSDYMFIEKTGRSDRDPRKENLYQAIFGDHPMIEVLVLEVDKVLSGICVFHTSFSTYRGQPGVFLEDLFIKKSLHRKGYGRLIFKELKKIAKSRGCYQIVWYYPGKNIPVREFYKSLGAETFTKSSMVLKLD